MAKRFIDTNIWNKQWFRQLELKRKLLWLYITTKCDHAGIWDADFEAASFFIGENVTDSDLSWLKSKLVPVKSNNGQKQYFFPSFVDYQYGYLKDTSKPHLSVRKRLVEKGLESYINKGLEKKTKGLLTLKEQEKDKEQYKQQDKVKAKTKETREKLFEKNTIYFASKMEGVKTDLLNEFIDYWTESNEKGLKMRFEMEKTFDIKRRLTKWINNNYKWTKGQKSERKKMHFSNS